MSNQVDLNIFIISNLLGFLHMTSVQLFLHITIRMKMSSCFVFPRMSLSCLPRGRTFKLLSSDFSWDDTSSVPATTQGSATFA